jgi:hypothetical protein
MSLEEEFDVDMQGILEKEHHLPKSQRFHSTRFAGMLARYGGVETARRLLKQHDFPVGTFSYPRAIGKLDLVMEYYVVMPKYSSLFSPEQICIADFRLKKGD